MCVTLNIGSEKHRYDLVWFQMQAKTASEPQSLSHAERSDINEWALSNQVITTTSATGSKTLFWRSCKVDAHFVNRKGHYCESSPIAFLWDEPDSWRKHLRPFEYYFMYATMWSIKWGNLRSPFCLKNSRWLRTASQKNQVICTAWGSGNFHINTYIQKHMKC